MTNEQLTAYLQDESYLYSVGYEELKTLVMQYPYSANLRILLLKKSYLDQNKDYERNLQMSATYTTNRKHLYKTIKKLKSFKLAPQNVILGEDYLELTELSNIERLLAEKQVTEAVQNTTNFEPLSSDWQLEIDDISSNEKEEKEEIFDLSNLSQNHDSQSNKNDEEDEEIEAFIHNLTTEHKESVDISDNSLTVHEVLKGHTEIELELEKNQIDFDDYVGEQTETSTPPDFEDDKSTISRSALNYYNDSDDIIDDDDIIVDEELRMMAEGKNYPPLNLVEELPIIQNSFSAKEEKESIDTVKKTNIKLEIVNQTNAPIVEKTVEKIVEKMALDAKPSFTEWLSQFRMTQSQTQNTVAKTIEKKNQPTEPQIVKPLPTPEHIRKASRQNMVELFEAKSEVPDNLFGLADETPRVHFDDEEDDDDDDVFSDDETTLKQKKLRPMHQLAAKSLIQDNEIVSETLAHLLVLQGNNEKAIDMYRKLILRFPEKSSYFAAKIEKISL